MMDQACGLRVEVSGWDLSERFFVERGTLRAGENEEKLVILHCSVRVGGLVFLRLLDHAEPSMSFPVAYRVREIRDAGAPGTFDVCLRQMWPKPEPDTPGATLRVDATRPAWLGMK